MHGLNFFLITLNLKENRMNMLDTAFDIQHHKIVSSKIKEQSLLLRRRKLLI